MTGNTRIRWALRLLPIAHRAFSRRHTELQILRNHRPHFLKPWMSPVSDLLPYSAHRLRAPNLSPATALVSDTLTEKKKTRHDKTRSPVRQKEINLHFTDLLECSGEGGKDFVRHIGHRQGFQNVLSKENQIMGANKTGEQTDLSRPLLQLCQIQLCPKPSVTSPSQGTLTALTISEPINRLCRTGQRPPRILLCPAFNPQRARSRRLRVRMGYPLRASIHRISA